MDVKSQMPNKQFAHALKVEAEPLDIVETKEDISSIDNSKASIDER